MKCSICGEEMGAEYDKYAPANITHLACAMRECEEKRLVVRDIYPEKAIRYPDDE